MNKNLNLVEILKDCPDGTKLYSTNFGEVKLCNVNKYTNTYPICVEDKKCGISYTTSDGRLRIDLDGECTLFPSKEQRDWSKFKVKKPKFDPKTLNPFDRVLVRLTKDGVWNATLFSHHNKELKWGCYPFVTTGSKYYSMCIPYNDDTKHLAGTSNEAPEFYRYWED